jgi:PAS domain S-box-containing protein
LDITKRKQAEERMRLMTSAIEQTSDGIAVVDMDGNLTYLNNAFAKAHGYHSDELIGKHLSIFHTPEQIPAVQKANEELQSKGEFVGEIWHVRRDGAVFPTLMQNSLLKDADGKPVGMIGTLRDITEIKEAHEALRKKEKELRVKAKSLEEVNTALRVLLKEREKDKTDLEEKVLSNVDELVLPYLERLKKAKLKKSQMSDLDILEFNLKEIVSPFSKKLSSKYLALTPTEIQVANLVKIGKTTKEIAESMNLAPKTVEFHRDSLRKKFGLKKSGANLRTYLLSM